MRLGKSMVWRIKPETIWPCIRIVGPLEQRCRISHRFVQHLRAAFQILRTHP